MTDQRLDLSKLIDGEKIGGFQKRIAALCSLTAVLLGFNTQSVGFIAPAVAQAFHLQARDLSLFFSLGPFGLLCGALLIAPLADKVGRRAVLFYCVPALGVFSLIGAFSVSVALLDISRFLTGLVVGGAIPNIIALTSEYAPRRRRAVMVAVMFSGFIVGSTIAGLTARWFISAGWNAVFITGGLLCFAAAPLILVGLPESVRFLILRGGNPNRIVGLARRLYPERQFDGDVRFTVSEAAALSVSVRALFEEGRFKATTLLWIVQFFSLFNIYLMANWLPTEMRAIGFPAGIAIFVGAILQIGGLFGIFFGWLADRIGANVALSLAYLTGALGVVLIRVAGTSTGPVMAAVFIAGFGILGGETLTKAVASILYPTEIRSTGIGWATGIGRGGSILGPALAGILLQVAIPASDVILLAVFPALIAATAALSLNRIRHAFSLDEEAMPV